MSAWLRRLLPRTAAGQLTGVMVAAVLFGVGLASLLIFYFLLSGGIGPSLETLAQIRAARIAAIVNGVAEAHSLSDSLYLAQRASSGTVNVTWARPPRDGDKAAAAPKGSIIDDVEEDLRAGWRMAPLDHPRSGADANAVYVKVDKDRILRFDIAPYSGLRSLVLTQILFTLGVVAFLIVFVSAWAVRWVTAPLTSIASAAHAFARPGDGEAGELAERGPIEVAKAARALNDMRLRVRRLVAERTRMLAAVSHDLRTPLTRLRLRIERLPDDPAKGAMLAEIATINEMLSETLAYMREVGQTEAAAPTDLPSLLQTICAQFSDTGRNVSYRGPDRLAISCRPHALARAVANLVDNAARFGETVEVNVAAIGRDVAIEVRDDGPGVPEDMLAQVFEPFAKADNARGHKGGFGLGLSIVREIAESHGGGVELENRRPHGLTARLRLPMQRAEAA